MKAKPYHAKLGISPQQELALPKISASIALLMAEKKEKGLPHDIWYYMEASPDSSVLKIRLLRETIQYKAGIPLEAYCAATEADPMQVLNAIIATADRLENYVVGSRMSNSKRDIADALIKSAKVEGELGTADRRLFMQATGMLPQPKGAQTLIQVTQNASSNAPTVIAAPSPEKTIRRLSDRMSQFQLPPAAEDADVFTDEDAEED